MKGKLCQQRVWQGLAGLGVLGVPFSDKYGGFGGGGIETMLIMESLGNHLVIEPYLSTVVLAGVGRPGSCGLAETNYFAGNNRRIDASIVRSR